MTRENKLALIVGFSLLLVVAILLADHLSPAQQEEMASLQPLPGDAADIFLPPGLDSAYRRQFGGEVQTNRPEGPAGHELTLFGPPQRAIQTQLENGRNERMAASPGAADLSPPVEVAGGNTSSVLSGPVSEANDFIEMGAAHDPILPPSRDDRIDARRHVIAAGDTLYALCRRYYGDPSLHAALAKYNRDIVPQSGILRTGITLLIPPADTLREPRNEPAARNQAEPQRRAADRPAGASPRSIATVEYTIRENDRLWDIAKAHLGKGGRYQEIIALNRDIIRNPDVLPIGRTIRIPAR